MAKPVIVNHKYGHLPATALGARNLGILHYYTGKACTKGHVGLRYASSGNCVHCIEGRSGKTFTLLKDRASKENFELINKALKDGFITYLSDKPCPKGHYERFTSSNNCVACHKASADKRRERAKWLRIEKLYGLTKQDINKMIVYQNNQCFICLVSFDEYKMHIDHCHKTGKTRALLCSKCNQAIGLFDESPIKLGKAMKYLEDYNHASQLSAKSDK